MQSKDTHVNEIDAVAERVEKIKLAADAEGSNSSGKEVEKPVVPMKDEAHIVKET